MTYEYKIAATLGALTTLQAQGVLWPRSDFTRYLAIADLGSGAIQGYGSPRALWVWDFISRAQYDILHGYRSALTTSLFIRTKDETDAFQSFSADMIWPPNLEWIVTRGIKFSLEFRNLVQQ